MRIRVHRALLTVVAFVLAGAGGGALAGVARAEGCANEQIRAREVYALTLPDCRAYEQVTPVGKGGTNPTGATDEVQASVSGDRIAFLVPANMPGAEGSSNFPTFLASRVGEGWSSRGLLGPTPSGQQDLVLGWSEDLSTVALNAPPTPPASEEGVYLRDSSSGSYRLAIPGGFGYLAGFSTDDSHLIFESSAQLLPGAAPGVFNLYELNNGNLSLAGVLPDGSIPVGGSFAGSYRWDSGDTSSGGAHDRGFYTQDTISNDGSRIFFTAGGTAQLYVRENGTTTVRVSASQRAVPDPNGAKPAAFMAATPDGSMVFFTSCEKLTNDSTAVSTGGFSCIKGGEGQDLYAYGVKTGRLSDLTADEHAGDALGAAVQGVLGASADGSYVYFVANGVLASGATPGECYGVNNLSSCSLYLWHAGHPIRFVATLNSGNVDLSVSDVQDWAPTPNGGGNALERTSRVATDGTLLFRSQRKLTSYDSAGFAEFYRYDPSSGRLACVSCNPTGAAPTGSATLQSIGTQSAPVSPESILTRNLSEDGSKVFFETTDPLVPQDTNNTLDVYEWEREGAGSCERSSESFSESSGGCLYLISTGRSSAPAHFADASANGENVFFFTDQALVGQDQDQLVDIYDARVNGGIAAQNSSAPVPCAGEACRPATSSAPLFGTPSSATLSGLGNLTRPVSKPAASHTPRRLTPAQRLAKALTACEKKPRKKRAACVKRARQRYGNASRAKKSNGRSR